MTLFAGLPGTGQSFRRIGRGISLMQACERLYACELASMPTNGRRQAEFLAGRAAAHDALALAGCPSAFGHHIGRDQFGAPQWPNGWIGSITHTADTCAAIAAPMRTYLSLGIDLESARGNGMDRAIARICMTPEDDRNVPPVLIFSAKEAVYKACHPILGGNLWFTDFIISDVWPDGSFHWQLKADPHISGRGQHRPCAAGVMTCVAIRHHDPLARHAKITAPTGAVAPAEKENAK